MEGIPDLLEFKDRDIWSVLKSLKIKEENPADFKVICFVIKTLMDKNEETQKSMEEALELETLQREREITELQIENRDLREEIDDLKMQLEEVQEQLENIENEL